VIANRTLLDELEPSLQAAISGAGRGCLRRVADLFASPSGDPCDERTALFDDVMRRLVDEIETSAGVHFAGYLARRPPRRTGYCAGWRWTMSSTSPSDTAVPRTLRPHDACRRRKKQQPSSSAGISTRKVIPETATDMLAERANREVSSPLCRPSRDDDLAVCTCSRIEIPRLHLLKLFADASAALKRRLSKEDPLKAVSWPKWSRGR